jgi:hypothetical protein
MDRLWDQERQEMSDLLETVTAENSETVMFSHPAAGPMTAAQAMDLTLAHLDHPAAEHDLVLHGRLLC